MRKQIGMMAMVVVILFIFVMGLHEIFKMSPKKMSIEQRMETCSFPTYDQILECEKIKAIRGVK